MKTFHLACLTALALPLAAHAAAPVPSFSTERVVQDIKVLASDDYEGRAPASAGEGKTVAYLVKQMQAAGLKPGGTVVNGTRGWTQDVPLLKSDIVGAPALAMTVAGQRLDLAQGSEIALRAALTGQTQVDIARAPLVFVGYGVKAPERNWDDFKGVDLRGKIMVVLVNDPDFEGGEGDFGGKAMTYYGRWTYKYEEAARQGAAGVLVVHEYAPASYGWPTVKNSNTNTMFDIVRTDPKASHTQMEGWIQRDLADRLLRSAGTSLDAAKKLAQTRGFKPIALTATLDARYQVRPETIVSKNVVGLVPGRSRPNETVIYSAHWDHLGIGQPDASGDRIYNGALDNASGTAALLELGRAYAKAPAPQRTVAFLAVTAEEKGLLGSEYYAANPIFPLATTVGVINMDGPFGGGRTRDFGISGSAKLGLLDLLVAEGARQGRHYSPDPRPEAGSFYRSDHFPMAKRGVPAISYRAGQDLVNGGTTRGKALSEEYTKLRYHQPADNWDPNWDTSGVPADLALLYNTGRALADSGRWPAWSADSEFRAARDATASQRK